MSELLQKIGRRERGEERSLDELTQIDRQLEEKYGIPFEEFYDVVESLQEHKLVEKGFDHDEILKDFSMWVKVAQKLGKLSRADSRWVRVFP